MTDLVSVRMGVLSRPRRRGGGAAFTLDVERERERLEERMGRESRDKNGQREETAELQHLQTPWLWRLFTFGVLAA